MTSTALPPAMGTGPPNNKPTTDVFVRLGGWRGLVDGAVPPMVFVAVNAAAGLADAGHHALLVAAGAAMLSAGVLGAARIRGGYPVSGVLRGLAGLVLAVAVALWTGQARDFFLPGIYVDAFYAVLLLGTVLVGRPAIGYAHAALFRSGRGWRTDPRLRRIMAAATVGWAGLYAVRAVTQMMLYAADQPELLGLAKTVLGWPMTALAVVLTLRAARRGRPEDCSAA